jgi:hypothetical protein
VLVSCKLVQSRSANSPINILSAVTASLIRMKFVVHFYYSIDINCMEHYIPPSDITDRTGDDYGIAIFSMIELSLSIMCVCFPAIKLLFNKYSVSSLSTTATLRRLPSSQMGDSLGSHGSQFTGYLRTVKRKLYSFVFRSQNRSKTLVDEERPPLQVNINQPESTQNMTNS